MSKTPQQVCLCAPFGMPMFGLNESKVASKEQPSSLFLSLEGPDSLRDSFLYKMRRFAVGLMKGKSHSARKQREPHLARSHTLVSNGGCRGSSSATGQRSASRRCHDGRSKPISARKSSDLTTRAIVMVPHWLCDAVWDGFHLVGL